MRHCFIDWCWRPEHGRGLCSPHLTRLRNGQSLQAPPRYQPEPKSPCKTEHCGELAYCQGMCRTHYERWRRTGDVELRAGPKKCELPGCTDKHYSRGWCKRHYGSWDKYGDPLGCIYPTPRGSPTLRAEQAKQTPKIRADLRMAQTMFEHGRRFDVEFYLKRAKSHGRKLTKLERELAAGLRTKRVPGFDAEIMASVIKLTREGISAEETGNRVGMTSRTIYRYRAKARENGEL